MTDERSEWFAAAMARLTAHQDLTPDEMRIALIGLTDAAVDSLEAAAFLTALAMKGETAEEIAAAVHLLRTRMVPLATHGRKVLDTCGTGGDGIGTFNISTASALVLAGAGVPIVKHGNRAASSRSGSADVLSALGVRVDAGPRWAQRCFDEVGFAFCFAPQHHPGLARLAPIRRRLKFRTIFNLLGPLLNPAQASYQLLGVGSPRMIDTYARAVGLLGIERTAIVCAADGLDEISLEGKTAVRLVEGGKIQELEWSAESFGLANVPVRALTVSDPTESAAIIEGILTGAVGPQRDIVLANCAAALLLSERVTDLAAGVASAEKAIADGSADNILKSIRRLSHESA